MPVPRKALGSAAVALVVTLGAGGCGFGRHAASGSPDAHSSTPSAAAGSGVRETGRKTYPIPAGFHRLLTLSETRAAFLQDDGGASALVTVDLSSGQVKQAWKVTDGWEVEQIALDDDTMVWVQQDRQQSDALEPVSWRIETLDLATGRERTALSSTSTTRLAPGILLWNDTLIYTRYHGLEQGTSDFRSLDLATGADRLLVRNVAAGQMAYDGTNLIATLTESRGHANGGQRSDLYVINRQPPRAITSTDHTVDPQLADGRLLWQDCRQAQCTVMEEPWPSGPPHAVIDGKDLAPSLGADFISLIGNHQGYYVPFIAPLDASKGPTQLAEAHGEHMVGTPEAHGDQVAWLTAKGAAGTGAGHLIVATIG
jgi:hypothetical protein